MLSVVGLGITLFEDIGGTVGDEITSGSIQAGDTFFAQITAEDIRETPTTPGIIGLTVDVNWDPVFITEIDPQSSFDVLDTTVRLVTSNFPEARSATLNNVAGLISDLTGESSPGAGVGSAIGATSPEEFSLLHFEALSTLGATFIDVTSDNVSFADGASAALTVTKTVGILVTPANNPPVASLQGNITIGIDKVDFSVTYWDDDAISTATIGTNDVLVTGPNGYSQFATFVSVDEITDGSPRTATYRVTSPHSQWRNSDNGMYQISMGADQVNDILGAPVSAGLLGYFEIDVANVPPTADAGGDYWVFEGNSITLTAAGSDDMDGSIVEYAWDTDNDGDFDDGTGETISFSRIDDDIYLVRVKVTDDNGDYDTAAATVNVINAVPVVDAGGPYVADEGETITLDASGSSDPGNDIVSYEWDLDGDGQYDDASGPTADYFATTGGTFTVAVKVTDDDGGWGASSASVTVLVANPEPGDANGDGRVNAIDLGILSTNYGAGGGLEWSDADFNGDGVVNVIDLGILSTHFGSGASNGAPVAFDDPYIITEDEVLNDNVLENDDDPDVGDTLTVIGQDTIWQPGSTLVGNPPTINPDGSFIYDATLDYQFLAEGETRQGVFEYTVADSNGASAMAQVTITVTGVNDAPVAVDDTEDVEENQILIIDVLGNDDDPDVGDTFTVTEAVSAAGAMVTVLGDGTLQYDPTGVAGLDDLERDEIATDMITYTIYDEHGGTDTAEVVVTITGVNDLPVADDENWIMGLEDTPLTVDLYDYFSDEETADADLTFEMTNAPLLCTAELQSDGHNVLVSKDANDSGYAVFVVRATDDDPVSPGVTEKKLFYIHFDPVNDEPVVDGPVPIIIGEDETEQINLRDYVYDVETPDEDLVFSNVSCTNGTVSLLADGYTLEFTPETGFNGLVDIEFEVTDTGDSSTIGDGTTAPPQTVMLSIEVEVGAINRPPIVDPAAPAIPAEEDTDIDINLREQVYDQETPDVQLLFANLSATGGTAVLDVDGYTVHFTPSPDYAGPASISVDVTDTGDGPAPAETAILTIDFTVENVNDDPVAEDTSMVTTAEDTYVDVDLRTRVEDVETDDDDLVFSVKNPINGTVQMVDAYTARFTPDASYNGSASFEFDVTDAGSATVDFTVNVTVTAVVGNSAPEVVQAIGTVDKTYVGSPIDDTRINLLTVFDDPNGDTLTFTVDSNSNPDLVNIYIDGNELVIEYLDDGYAADQDRTPAVVSVTASDVADNPGAELTATDTFTVTVDPVQTGLVQLVALPVATDTDEFDFFMANATSQSAIGGARMQMDSDTNGPLSYSLMYMNSDGVDLDGTRTPGDSSDDVTALTFRDLMGNIVFDILTDDDLLLDAAAGTVAGEWEDIAAYKSDLYDGELFIYAETASGNFKVSGNNIKPSAELLALPTSLTEVTVGDTYVVEIWVQDSYALSTGMVGVFADMMFNKAFSTAVDTGASDNTPFGGLLYDAGSIDNIAGEVTGIGGGTIFAGVGLDPGYARLGYVEFTATDATAVQDFTIDVTGFYRQGAPNVDPNQLVVNGVSVAQNEDVATENVRFMLHGSSNVTVDGVSFSEELRAQVPSSDNTLATGYIDAVVTLNSSNEPTSIKFVDANIVFTDWNGGELEPGLGGSSGTDVANAGLTNPAGSANGIINYALRDMVFDLATDQPIQLSGASFLQDTIEYTASLGSVDYLGSSGGSMNLAGCNMAEIAGSGSSGWGVLINVGDHLELALPVRRSVDISGDTGRDGDQIAFIGTITADWTLPAMTAAQTAQTAPQTSQTAAGKVADDDVASLAMQWMTAVEDMDNKEEERDSVFTEIGVEDDALRMYEV